MSRGEFEENRQRVYEIMGIDPLDRRYNVHHVLTKADFKRSPVIRETYGFEYRDSKANLFPLDKREHARLHQKLEEIDRRHKRRRLGRI